MTQHSLELLDRALAYTCGALGGVTQDAAANLTPCRGWHLDRLLTHMDDGLDALADGAGGHVPLRAAAPARVRVERLRSKAGHLHGLWSVPPGQVQVGDVVVDTSLVVLTATLEIAVHGWDVARSTGADHPFPDALAVELLPVAVSLVADDDRGSRFAAPLPTGAGAPPSTRLLAFLGREARS